jgi:uncharacterized protein
MPITALYAALIAVLFIVLSFRVINVRGSAKVSLGDGGNKELEKRIRAHANCAEYAPLGLILIGLAESLHAGSFVLHALGGTLLAARTLHAVGISKTIMRLRLVGMVLTFGVIGVAAGLNLWLSLPGLR